eukprot:Gb_23294 [translate_table: standard]
MTGQNILRSGTTSSETMFREGQLSFSTYPQMSRLQIFSRKIW